LWVLGWQRDAQNFPHETKDYPLLRRYSIDGKQTGAYLPLSLFPRGLRPGADEWQRRRITVTPDRVGVEVYSGNLGYQREWVELDLSGKVLGRWRLDTRGEFPGVAFTNDDQAYVHRYDRETKTRQVFRLNRSTAGWDRIQTLNEELYGSDGEDLVFAQWSGGVMHLSWLPQP